MVSIFPSLLFCAICDCLQIESKSRLLRYLKKNLRTWDSVLVPRNSAISCEFAAYQKCINDGGTDSLPWSFAHIAGNPWPLMNIRLSSNVDSHGSLWLLQPIEHRDNDRSILSRNWFSAYSSESLDSQSKQKENNWFEGWKRTWK